MAVVNRAAEEINGQTRELQEAISTSHLAHLNWEMLYPDGSFWPVEDCPLVRATLHGEVVRDAEMIIRRSDGTERWILVNGAPVRNQQGQIIAVGPGRFEKGERVPMELKQGETVLYGKYSGAEVTLEAESFDLRQMRNRGDADGPPIVVPGVAPAPDWYDGQFIQMDVVTVERR